MTYQKYETPNNLACTKFQTTDGTFGTSKLQTPNNFAYPKLQTHKHISTPAPEVKECRQNHLHFIF